MKRSLCMLMAAMMLMGSLSGCGSSPEKEARQTQESEESSTRTRRRNRETAEETEEDAEQEPASSSKEEGIETPEIPDKEIDYARMVERIRCAGGFKNGITLAEVVYLDDANRSLKDTDQSYHESTAVYMIDITGKILLNLDSLYADEVPYMDEYLSGIDVPENGDVILMDDYLILRDGTVLASPEKDGYDRIPYPRIVNGQFIVSKTEKSVDGNRLLIGVMNTAGEFVRPLNEDSALAGYLRETGHEFDQFLFRDPLFYDYDTGSMAFPGQDAFLVELPSQSGSESGIYYDVANGTLLDRHALPHIGFVKDGTEIEYHESDGAYPAMIAADGTILKVLAEDDRYYPCERHANPGNGLENVFMTRSRYGHHLLFSPEGELLADFTVDYDSGAEVIQDSFHWDGSVFTYVLKNPDGDYYRCGIKASGGEAFEPQLISEQEAYGQQSVQESLPDFHNVCWMLLDEGFEAVLAEENDTEEPVFITAAGDIVLRPDDRKEAFGKRLLEDYGLTPVMRYQKTDAVLEGEELYRDILSYFAQQYKDNWRAYKKTGEDSVPYVIPYYLVDELDTRRGMRELSEVMYNFADINRDGVTELLLFTTISAPADDDGDWENKLHAVFTVEKGKIVPFEPEDDTDPAEWAATAPLAGYRLMDFTPVAE